MVYIRVCTCVPYVCGDACDGVCACVCVCAAGLFMSPVTRLKRTVSSSSAEMKN